MTRRLSKVASELNVGISTIVTFLNKKGYKIYFDQNTKVSDDIYNILIKEFSYYMAQKKRSDEIKLQKGFPQDLTDEPTQIDNVQNILVSRNDDINLSLEIKNIYENELIKDNPKVFVSYSWDSEEHKQWVENFARVLISNGIITILDQYELSIGDNLQLFMEKHIPDVDKVIIILTPNF